MLVMWHYADIGGYFRWHYPRSRYLRRGRAQRLETVPLRDESAITLESGCLRPKQRLYFARESRKWFARAIARGSDSPKRESVVSTCLRASMFTFTVASGASMREPS